MTRVVVIGTSCVGKTTFARSLARVLRFPHIELDTLYWQPNWVPRASDEFRALTVRALPKIAGLQTATTALNVIKYGRAPRQ